MSESCPTEAQLRDLVNGSLSDIDAQPLELHLDRCDACQQAVQELAADGMFWKSAAASLSDDKITGPGLDRMLETLQHQSREDAEEIGEAIELKLSFIEPATEPGTIGRLRHYDILRVAGRGGMGIVLKAFDRSLRRIVAIKLLAPHLAGNGQARQRFIREGRAAAAICHQHVVTIHAVEESPPFLVMQYVHGETLESRIHRNGSLGIRDAIRIAMQTAQGLAAAHAQGVVHRDIKPANILLENGVARVRITDFGLARVVDDASLTQSGVVAGTPQYMAPEQANGDAVDERADLFSLGSVLYTMLAGHAPFRATTAMGVLKRLCDHTARPIREINPETPDWLVVLINRLHAKHPADRFHSAAEVANLLERGLAGLQSVVATGSPPAAGIHKPAIDEPVRQEAEVTLKSPEQSTPIGASSGGTDFFLRAIQSIPIWLLFAIIGVVVMQFVPEAGAMGVIFALVAYVMPRFLPGFSARILGASRTEASSETPIDSDRPTLRILQLLNSRSGKLRLCGWVVLWGLPAILWTNIFFFEEWLALQGSSDIVARSDGQIRLTLIAVFAAWLAIAAFWFRNRNSDGTSGFKSPDRRKGLMTVAGLAAIFCMCGYGTWYSDVFWPTLTRIDSRNPQYPIPGDNDQQKLFVQIETDKYYDGIVVTIDGDTGPQTISADEKRQFFTGRAAAYPWTASLGQSKFASGIATFNPGQITRIQLPRPRLIDLIAGRWEARSIPKTTAEVMTRAPESEDLEFEFRDHTVIHVQRFNGGTVRTDLQVQIDETVTPALITMTNRNGVRLAGIIRFEASHTSESGSGGMAMMGVDAGMGGMPSIDSSFSTDRVLLCFSYSGFLRPWQFESDEKQGITLFSLTRPKATESLEHSLSLEPLPIATDAALVRRSVDAWSQRLNVPADSRNSIGIDLALVPPAHCELPPRSALRDSQKRLPDLDTLPKKTEQPRRMPVQSMSQERLSIVTYPFVMSRKVISMYQFLQFVAESNYVTDAERSESYADALAQPQPPMTSAEAPNDGTDPAAADSPDSPAAESSKIGGWVYKDGAFHWQDGLTLGSDSTGVSDPVTVVSHNDAVAFCRWLSAKENREYRLPTSQEWTAAMQLGVARQSEVAPEDTTEFRAWFDAKSPGPLQITIPRQLFGEWTVDSEDEYHTVVHQHLSKDSLRFDLSQQYVARPAFRSSEIGFRVVAEVRALTAPEVQPADAGKGR